MCTRGRSYLLRRDTGKERDDTMKTTLRSIAFIVIGCGLIAQAEEKTLISLRDFSGTELKYAGFSTASPLTIRIDALGGGGDHGWSYKTDKMYAYGWIIDARTRTPVWTMTAATTQKSRDDRSFEGFITLDPGSYEVYFAAYAFAFHSTFSHINVNVDHRRSPLFGSSGKKDRHFFSWLTDWWSDDLSSSWTKRSVRWGIDLKSDDPRAAGITTFTPPLEADDIVLQATGLEDNVRLTKAFTLSAPTTLRIRSLGEGEKGAECVDCAWLLDLKTRKRVWDTKWRDTEKAGGARKNILVVSEVRLDKGTYGLYAITDDSHSPEDWNDAPPYDPLNWGVSIAIPDPDERGNFKETEYKGIENVIVSLTKMRDDESRSEGFALKQDALLRVYAFGERSNSRRTMADYGTIIDAKTRARVWTMDVDRTQHAGGASKNRFIDEVISLPKGNYIVTYVTDDSHAYGDWNDTPPFDEEQYGITVALAGTGTPTGIVSRYVEERDRNVIAQIIRVGSDADRAVRFTLDRTTRIRIHAMGEGQNREMFDYGWIEDARTGTVVWEMTYGMTFHAGGGRKNRMLTTTVVLDKGEYALRYVSDDSHAYNDWNVSAPDDPEYWGITLFRETGPEAPVPPTPPPTPAIPGGQAYPR